VAVILHPSLPTTWRALATKFTALTVFWLLFGFASLLWTTDPRLGIAELLSIAVGASVALSLAAFQQSDPLIIDFLRRGWIFALCAMYIVIAWELMTGRHLEGSYVMQHQLAYGDTFNLGVQGSLDNPNDLAAFLVFSAPFVVWSLLRSRKALATIGLGALVLSIGALTVFTGARLSLLTFALQLTIFCFLSKRRRGRVLLIATMALSIMAGALLVITTTLEKLSGLFDQVTGGDGTPIRRNLFLNGIEFLVKSYGWGIGAGGFTGAMQQGAGSYPTSNSAATIVNPHSGIIEVSQYGLLILIPVLAILFASGSTLWRGRKFALTTNRNSLYLATQVGLVALLGLVILSFEGSEFLTATLNWMFVATVLVHGTHAESNMARSFGAKSARRLLKPAPLPMDPAPRGIAP
jgi:teichuronic acid biosynthesis protein TuaE